MASDTFALQVNASIHKDSFSHSIDHLRTSLSSTFKPLINELHKLPMKVDISQTIQSTSSRILDAFVDTMFRFVDQPLLSSQSSFAPVDETVEAVEVTCIEGKIPTDFPEGVYVRNGGGGGGDGDRGQEKFFEPNPRGGQVPDMITIICSKFNLYQIQPLDWPPKQQIVHQPSLERQVMAGLGQIAGCLRSRYYSLPSYPKP